MIRRFNRWELKYQVKASTVEALLPVVAAHMSPDPEGGAAGVYRVNSLYYDTLDFRAHRAKLDGVNFRRKLRIRCYGELEIGLDRPVMVEIKQRINRTTQKRRVLLPLRDAYALCDGTFDPGASTEDRRVIEEVLFLSGAQQLAPACVISYERQAYVGSVYEPGLRITFDRELTVARPSHGLEPGAQRHYFLPPDRMILEVKTNDVVPIWVARLLAAEGCRVGRFSKYCSGLEHLRGLAPGQAIGRGEVHG